MKRHEKINDRMQPVPGPRLRDFVYFLMIVATIWAALVFAPGAFAASGAMTNADTSIQIRHSAVIGGDTGRDYLSLEAQVLPSKHPGCCERGSDSRGISGSCQTSCPAHGCGLSGIQAAQSPTPTLASTRFRPLAAIVPNSLLHQRLNRPPINDRSA